jgi:hypothetical protein
LWAELIVQPIAEVHNLLVKKIKVFPELLRLSESSTGEAEFR